LESGQADNVIDVENFGKGPRLSNNGIACPFQKVRKREEVDMQWVKSVVSSGLPMNLFDNPEVHKTVFMTAECGQNYIRTKPGGVKEPTLPHRTFFTTTVNHHPIVKIIMGVRSLHTLRTSIDTMGQEKTMDFITVLILEHI
jgi:hypothetical protein